MEFPFKIAVSMSFALAANVLHTARHQDPNSSDRFPAGVAAALNPTPDCEFETEQRQFSISENAGYVLK
ncbi:hypothetical protein BLA27_10085 [Brucella cytisi]|uniref:Uncharacterized protein n=1 Tax=Brucella cytisi TaxID=407152 RepID=A0A1J6HMN5_9HYPH|nr:hypothetical protein BLA27_10085 [Brucella cytisi]